MRKGLGIWLILLVIGFALFAYAQEEPATEVEPQITGPFVNVITIDDAIMPGTAEFIQHAINASHEAGAEALVIELDTPGGLVDSTREIVQELLSPPLPVIVYVSPPGAHAGSAGLMITIAANIAAMAPGTNIGAATPVTITGTEMDDTMQKKVTNDVAAWVKSIAEERGRNTEWAVKAVTEAASITANEALKLNVIDIISDDLPSLLASIDGKKVIAQGKERALATKDINSVRLEMNTKQKILAQLSSPYVVLLLLALTVIGFYIEFSNPGLILPGVVGAICLILFLLPGQYHMQLMPLILSVLSLRSMGMCHTSDRLNFL